MQVLGQLDIAAPTQSTCSTLPSLRDPGMTSNNWTLAGPRYVIRGSQLYVIAAEPRRCESYQQIGNRAVIAHNLISADDAAQMLQQYPSCQKSARSPSEWD